MNSFGINSTYETVGYPGNPNLPLFSPLDASKDIEKMVNLPTGSLNLSFMIAELPVGNGSSYNITLGYQSGIKVDQQASWVGLGWVLNPGAILRSIKGVPDDAKGNLYYNQGVNMSNQTPFGTITITASSRNALQLWRKYAMITNPTDYALSYCYSSNDPVFASLSPLVTIMGMPENSDWVAAGNTTIISSSPAWKSLTYPKYGLMWNHLGTDFQDIEWTSSGDERSMQVSNGSKPAYRHKCFRTLNSVGENATGSFDRLVLSGGVVNDNYLVQGPAPAGRMFFDYTNQSFVNGSGNVDPLPYDPQQFKQSGQTFKQGELYYLMRQSLNTSIGNLDEMSQQGVKTRYTCASDGSISSIIITDVNGTKYFYAKPIKNSTVSSSYISDGNWSSLIESGSHAVEWLLTAIEYPDFKDLSSTPFTGLNYDDLKKGVGGYVLFQYNELFSDFQYQEPNVDNGVPWPYNVHQPGLMDYLCDQMRYSSAAGKIGYCYLSRIETPLMFALFSISDRYDACETQGRKLKKLDAVTIYSKNTGLELKTIKFNYSYDLAKGSYLASAENTNKGRLTLNGIEFNANGKKITGPKFYYDVNPSIPNPTPGSTSYGQSLFQDRWGNYKSNATQWDHFVTSETDAAAWSLTKLILPFGGQIAIDYEMGDYGYVGIYKPLDKRGSTNRDITLNWNTVSYKLGPDIRVKQIQLSDNNAIKGVTKFIYSPGLSDNTTNRANSSGVVTDESPSYSAAQDVDCNLPIWGYYQPWRCNIGQRDPAMDNIPFAHVYENVQVLTNTANGAFRKQFTYFSPRDQRPFMYLYSNITPPTTCFDSWIIDYRPSLFIGMLKSEKSINSSGKEIGRIEFNYNFGVNAPPNNNARYFLSSYTSVTHHIIVTPSIQDAANWTFKLITTKGCDYPCSTDPFRWGNQIFYGGAILQSIKEKKDDVLKTTNMLSNYLDPESGIDRLTGLSTFKNESPGDNGYPQKITTFSYAFAKYPGMKSANILSALFQKTIYEKMDWYPNSIIRFASASTYSNNLGCSQYVPFESYIWNVNKNQDGTIISGKTYSDLNLANPAVTPDWQLTGTMEKYNSYSAPLQIKNAKGVSSTIIYRNDINVPIGSIANTTLAESGVFTGDYEKASLCAYWDFENGWYHSSKCGEAAGGTVELSAGANAHFGEKSIHVVNDIAAGKTNRVYPGKAYVMTAWVKLISGTINMSADFEYCALADAVNWPSITLTKDQTKQVLSATPISPSEINGKWKLMRLEIPASVTAQLSSSVAWYARAWVGNTSSEPSFEAFVDDVRFYPAKALVTTTYYDSKWLQPVLSVDANNNPGQKVVYDDFGRPKEWYKIDKTNPSTKTKVQSKVYHLVGEE